MRFSTEFRNSELARGLLTRIRERSRQPVRLMEFCGGHTVAIFRHGIRQLLPPNIEMISGPGCPVCVTSMADIDRAIALSRVKDVIITTFGDMLKVPGSRGSLQQARAGGADIRMVYSTLDAVQIARDNRLKPVVFLGIGFETTAPTVAASILEAAEQGVDNYFVLSQNKLSPPAIKALLDSGEVKLDGLICPGHVSAVTGAGAWDFIALDYGIPCVVAGFEPVDILQSVAMLVEQAETGRSRVEIAYRRGVNTAGNRYALDLMAQVYEPADAEWRGFGTIKDSGLKIKKEYAGFDAGIQFNIEIIPAPEPKGCLCGEVLRGIKTPRDCRLFGKVCNPESPVGPCMVSSEGSCAAYFLYGDGIGE